MIHDGRVYSILAFGRLYVAQHNKDKHNNKPKWGIANERLFCAYCSCVEDGAQLYTAICKSIQLCEYVLTKYHEKHHHEQIEYNDNIHELNASSYI